MLAVGLLILAVVVLLYLQGTKNFGYWKNQGIRCLRPLPFIGNFYNLIWRTHTPIEIVQELYKAFKQTGSGGIFVFSSPCLLVTDLDLIKLIMVKDADYFINKYNWINEKTDPIFSKNVLVLKDKRWRDMRATLSPAFTSSKMKNMFTFMDKCSEQVTQHLEGKIREQVENKHPDGNVYDLEVKTFFKRYATDVIASTAFGLEVDSLKDPDNEFYKMGEDVTNFGGLRMIKFTIAFMFPFLAKFVDVSFFGEKYSQFFESIIHNSIKEREEKRIIRPDMIHLLMEARDESLTDESVGGEKKQELTEADITAQAMIFFFGGFETISSVLAFIAHEIAVNPDVQERLQKEVDAQVDADGGVTYDSIINKMPYLDMVFNETLRKWPPAVMIDREVSLPYTIPASSTQPEVKLKRGDLIWIPSSSLQRDPAYFPNPEKFDPERFSEENKANIVPYTYIPFGFGPRHCIGMRFGVMEIKTCIVHVLRKFDIVPISKTTHPLQLRKDMGMMLGAKNGFWVGVKPRTL